MPSLPISAPRAHRDPAEVARRISLLHEPHVAPLTAFVERLRPERGGDAVPWFDPTEAGIHAPILLLLEAPGARATGAEGPRAAAGGSGFISPDNDDPSAENMWRLLRDAGVNRATDVVTWNIVPWYLGDGSRIRAATVRDLDEARPYLAELLSLLPALRVVVLLGRKAARGWQRAAIDGLAVLEAPHPSPLVLNRLPEARDAIRDALKEALRLARS